MRGYKDFGPTARCSKLSTLSSHVCKFMNGTLYFKNTMCLPEVLIVIVFLSS